MKQQKANSVDHILLQGSMFNEVFYYSSLSTAQVHSLLAENGFEIELSIENYKEKTTGDRDLLVVAKKVTH